MIPSAHITAWRTAVPWAEDPNFLLDIKPLLSASVAFEPRDWTSSVLDQLISLMPGEPWKGLRSS